MFSIVPENNFLEKGAFYTATEIEGQPLLWKETTEKFFKESAAVKSFVDAACKEASQIILTGAGTSAYIGLSLQGAFFRNTQIISRAIATTDIVSHPQDYFNAKQTNLIISFARSGNSPESCAALQLADQFSGKCFHLIITCDAEGALAKYKSNNPTCVFILPEKANDKSLAMTGSYSAMLLCGLLTAYINQKEFCKKQVSLCCEAGSFILQNAYQPLQQLSTLSFQRAVFLGSGPLYATATEAALKLQELTDGQIICKADTFLGFRHGPKAVIDETTLVVYFFSNSPYVQRYEEDLLQDMKSGNNAMFQVGVAANGSKYGNVDLMLKQHEQVTQINEDFLPVCSIVTGQLIGLCKSMQLGYMPDTPSVSGSISRVVQGVHIYPLEAV